MAIFVRPITQEERVQLESLWRRRTGSAGLARRASIILRSAQRERVPAIASGLGLFHGTVRKWIRRFTDSGLEGLRERPRSGRPPVYSELELGRVIQLALTQPKELGKPFRHWSLDTLEEELRREGCLMGRAHIHRVLRAEGVKWQKERTWFASPEPKFAVKGGDCGALPASPGGKSRDLPR